MYTGGWFIGAIRTVNVIITVPLVRDAARRRYALELIAAARSGGAINRIFIAPVPAVIVSVTQVTWRNTDGSTLAFYVPRLTSADRAVSFIRSAVVIAVVPAIADQLQRDAPPVFTGELCGAVAAWEKTPFLVAVVTTVIVVIAAIMIGDTFPIGTGEGSGLADVKCTQRFQLVAAVPTVVVIITFPGLGDAVPIETGELGIATPGTSVTDTVLIIIGQVPVAFMWTLALSCIWTWCTDMAAAPIKRFTRIATLLLFIFRNYGNAHRLDAKTGSHRNLI